MRTSEMFYFVDHGKAWARNEAGLMTLERKFERRCWADRLGVRWIIVKWNHWDEGDWIEQFGTKIPFPRHGEWLPIENWKLEEEEDPTLDLTDKFVWALKRDREMNMADWIKRDEEDFARYLKSQKSELSSRVRNAMTAYGRIPGTHGGQTEFQSGTRGPEINTEPMKEGATV